MPKLLLNALRAKIAGEQSAPSGTTSGDGQAATGAGVSGAGASGGTGATGGDDFHLVSLTPAPEPEIRVQLAPPSAPQMAPQTTDEKTAGTEGPRLVPVTEPLPLPAQPSEAKPKNAGETGALHFSPVTLTPATSQGDPAMVQETEAPTVRNTQQPIDLLDAQLQEARSKKRKLTFKRSIPRLAGLVVVVMMAFSFVASLPKQPGNKTTITNVSEGAPTSISHQDAPDTVAPMRFYVELKKTCKTMPAEAATQLQKQLQAEERITIHDAIAYVVFACKYNLEADANEGIGFGRWAAAQGIIPDKESAKKPLTRDVMQKIFTASYPPPLP